jgi:uncharacterized integral membrane protein (TIGR00698 family)
MVKNKESSHVGDLYGDLALAGQEATSTSRTNLFPGLAICVIASAAAAWLSEQYGAPIILMGLLIGLSLNFVASDPRAHPGLDFASKTCLRWGIVVLGTQVTVQQIGDLGAQPFLALLVVMACAMGAALIGARLARQSSAAGLLAGGATAICGASAALAIYGVLGRERVDQAQFALTLVGISIASAIAMSFYPPLAGLIGLDDRQAGFLIGASIHDVAQAIGGGYAFSDAAGGYATIVKLARVALLAPVVLLVALIISRSDGAPDASMGRGRRLFASLRLPWFILGFFAAVCVNSLLPIAPQVTSGALVLSKALLLLAIVATGMRSRLDLVMKMGWRAAVPVIAATLASLISALAFTLVLA